MVHWSILGDVNSCIPEGYDRRMTPHINRLLSFAVLVIALVASGCSTRQQNLSELSPESMYEEAERAFEERDYDLALRLLEFFVSEHIGHPRAADARLLLGDLRHTRGEYAIAATHFQRLIQDFPGHPRSLEARFKICDSYYRLSPRPALDQEFTIAAVDHCESVMNSFRGTPEGDQAAELVSELRNKLAQKAYENGLFYLRRNAYDAAVVYFEQVLANYPDSAAAPTALASMVEAFDRIGYVEDSAEAKERLLRDYPDSSEAAELAP